jgi:hypothetical protein
MQEKQPSPKKSQLRGIRFLNKMHGRNARSSNPGMMLQKKCKKHYGDS